MAYLKEEVRVANWVNILGGVWLIMAPFLIWFSEREVAKWNSIGVGLAMIIVAVYGAARPLHKPGVIWINFVLAIWLLLSPFLLGFSSLLAPTLSHVAIGLLVAGLAAGAALGARKGS